MVSISQIQIIATSHGLHSYTLFTLKFIELNQMIVIKNEASSVLSDQLINESAWSDRSLCREYNV